MNMRMLVTRIFLVLSVSGLIYGFLRLPEFFNFFRTGKSINVLAWPNVLDAQYLQEFENKTGIKVYLTYFENYEELIVKMSSASGDYDLVMASDYAVKALLENNVVKEIDKNRLDFWQQIYPVMKNLYFDPQNKYSVPFAWEIYGIGIDINQFQGKAPDATWGLLFDPKIWSGNIGMIDDAREVVAIAALYLFDNPNQLGMQQLAQIKQLLLKQKQRVAMYTDLRTDYLLVSQVAPVVLGISSDIYNAKRFYNNIQFLLPKEGSFIVIDNFMITKSSKKDDQVYALLNYLYQPKVLKKYAKRYNFFPVLPAIFSEQDQYFLTPTQHLFSRLHFFPANIAEQPLRDLWIALKS